MKHSLVCMNRGNAVMEVVEELMELCLHAEVNVIVLCTHNVYTELMEDASETLKVFVNFKLVVIVAFSKSDCLKHL